jgi:hypothetical protein
MAGRPKMMFKRVGELVGRFNSLCHEMYEIRPAIYAPESHPNVRDPVYLAWQSAGEIGLDFLAALAALQDQLLTKADIRPPGDMLITVDGETRTLDEWCSEYNVQRERAIDRWLAGEDWERAIMKSLPSPSAHSTQTAPPGDAN